MKFINLKNVLFFLFLSATVFSQTTTGELKRWHKVSLTFNGPNTSETANPNPFSDYRLEVTFTHNSSNRKYKIPGFFAACGNAANNGCSSGNKWRVHFVPDETGVWTWEATFKKGSNVAINGGGTSAGFMDGNKDTFSIAESDKTGVDFRNKSLGRLQYVGEHYLKHTGTNPQNPNGKWFVKAGADSPENAFNYVDFDATPSYKNNLNKIGSKTWQPHQQDYVASDASSYTWANGKGTEILGMVNYLHKQGANVMSFLTWNTSGDCGAVFPHVLKVTEQEYGSTSRAQQWNKVHKDRFDVSKLGQWEKVMEYADKKGIYLHFKTMETENDNKMDGDTFGRQRKLYYRELIARFAHHLALNWNITEETTLPNNVVKSTATYIKELDAYNHNIVIHTYPGQKDQRYTPLLGNKSDLTGASLQSNQNSIHNDVKEWLKKSKDAGKKWVVANDEQGSASQGIRVSDKDVRKKVLWGTLLAGGAGVEYYSGYLNDDGDINGNDHRKRGKKYKEGSYALNFFNQYLQSDLVDMVSSDGVTNDRGDFVFAKASKIYAVYRPNGGSTGLNLPTGNNNYNVQWFNPRTGGSLTAKNSLGSNLVAPDSNDWVALITKKDTDGGGSGDGDCVALEVNGVAAVEAEHFVSQSKTEKRQWYKSGAANLPSPDPDPIHNVGASETGYIEILPDTRVTHGDPLKVGESFSDTPGKVAIVNYKVQFSSAGKYFVWVRAHSTGSEDNGVHVGINGTWPSSGQKMQWCTGKNKWTWESKQRTAANHCGEAQRIFINVPSAGVHTISFSMREDGFEMDKFVLSKSYTKPTGTGPDEVLTGCGGENSTPQVSLTSPTNGSDYMVDESIQLIANATDSDGSVSKVEFFANGNLVASKNAAPFEATIKIAQAGSYNITAKATDNSGAVATSLAKSITVKESATALIQLPGVFEAENYTAKSGTIKAESTPGSTGQNLGFIKNGDFTEYEVDVASSGEYSFSIYASTAGIGGQVEIFENGVSVGEIVIPVNGEWHQYKKYSTNVALTSGEKTLKLLCKGDSGFLFNMDKLNATANQILDQDASLSPIQDAYLQGGTSFNTDMIRIESGKREGYLLFDLSTVSGTIKKASLSFTVYSDSGNGALKVNKGTVNSWEEGNLSNSNKPDKGDLLGEINENYTLSKEVTIPLNVSKISGSKLSLIVSMIGGNDFAFASKENGSVSSAKLSVTYGSANSVSTSLLKEEIKLFPNPVANRLNFSDIEKVSKVRIFNYSGVLLKEEDIKDLNSIDISEIPKGLHIVKLYNESGVVVVEKKILKK